VKLHIRPIMHSARLCEAGDWNPHQALIVGDLRKF